MAKSVTIVVALLVAATVVTVGGQALPPCASALLPCAAYLQNPVAKPPVTCCMPLTQTVSNEPSCICSLLASPDLLKALNATADQTLLLLSSCGVATLDLCSAPASQPSDLPSNSPPPPPGSPSTSEAYHAHWIGLSSLMSLFLTWYSIIA